MSEYKEYRKTIKINGKKTIIITSSKEQLDETPDEINTNSKKPKGKVKENENR